MSDSIACLHKRIPASSRAAQKQADFDLPKGRNSLLFGVGIRAALARIGCFEHGR